MRQRDSTNRYTLTQRETCARDGHRYQVEIMKNTYLACISLAALVALSGCLGIEKPKDESPPPAPPGPLAKAVAATVSASAAPGVVGLVLWRGRTEELQAAGVRVVGRAAPMSVNDRMGLGSCTKAMTSLMVARVVETNPLSWSATLAETLDPGDGKTDPGWAQPTLLDLLHHRSGMFSDADFVAAGFTTFPVFTGTATEQRQQLVSIALQQAPAVKRGEFHYSNAGYATAALMAERAAGSDWRTLMQQQVLLPLGISAGFGWPGEGLADGVAGHKKIDGRWAVIDPATTQLVPPYYEPAGALAMSLPNYGKFLAATLDAMSGKPRIAGSAAWATLLKIVGDIPNGDAGPVEETKMPDACGWKVINHRGRAMWFHGGSTDGFSCYTFLVPSAALAVTMAANAGQDTIDLLEQRGIQVVDAYLDREGVPPVAMPGSSG